MRKVLACAALALILGGCAHRKRVRAQTPVAPPVGYAQTGIASWYGHPYHGRPAADGEIYDMETMVAAHRTFAFNTWVRVVNLENGRSVDVRIIDRGPFVDGRIIDLSHAAAGAIDMVRAGVVKVRIEVIEPPRQAAAARPPRGGLPRPAEAVRGPESTATTAPGADPELVPPAPNEPPIEAGPAVFAVQVAFFRDRAHAERVRAQMEARYGTARVVLRAGETDLWRVLVGAEPTEDGANALASRLVRETDTKSAFVVRLDAR